MKCAIFYCLLSQEISRDFAGIPDKNFQLPESRGLKKIRDLPTLVCMSKRKNSKSEYFLNVRACAEIDTPHEDGEFTSLLLPKQIQCLSLATVALI